MNDKGKYYIEIYFDEIEQNIYSDIKDSERFKLVITYFTDIIPVKGDILYLKKAQKHCEIKRRILQTYNTNKILLIVKNIE